MNILQEKRLAQLDELEKKIGYKFRKIELLNRALTHSSFANEYKEKNLKYNERLEFLGDSVLGLTVSDFIFKKYPHYPEGELTKLRAVSVCEPSLSSVAKKLNLGNYLLLGKGEEATGGRERVSILADAFEAIIGAIHLDGELIEARNFILQNLTPVIENAVKGKLFLDYKTQLQEVIQKKNNRNIDYQVVKEAGPDHNKVFYVEVSNGDQLLGKGTGKSKKEAEQSAAKEAIGKLGESSE